MEKKRIENQVKRLEMDRSGTIKFLKSKGVTSLKDVGDDTDLKYAALNLKRASEEITKMESDMASYDKAISSIESMLHELERNRIADSVAMTEDDYRELRTIQLDLNEQLGLDDIDLFEAEELDNLLQDTLQVKPASDAGSLEGDDMTKAGNENGQ
ncbi:MAG: hypothetical protein R3C03_13980 [Pirellulaceae bacterium]